MNQTICTTLYVVVGDFLGQMQSVIEYKRSVKDQLTDGPKVFFNETDNENLSKNTEQYQLATSINQLY